jgi:hypothetical protein
MFSRATLKERSSTRRHYLSAIDAENGILERVMANRGLVDEIEEHIEMGLFAGLAWIGAEEAMADRPDQPAKVVFKKADGRSEGDPEDPDHPWNLWRLASKLAIGVEEAQWHTERLRLERWTLESVGGFGRGSNGPRPIDWRQRKQDNDSAESEMCVTQGEEGCPRLS